MTDELLALHARLAALESRLQGANSSCCHGAAGYENDAPVVITANDTALYWRRNSYEPNHPETELPAVTFDRFFQFEGLYKRCWVGNSACAQRPWNPCPSAAIVRESGNVSSSYEIELMWDDSRVPAQARNIGCIIKVG